MIFPLPWIVLLFMAAGFASMATLLWLLLHSRLAALFQDPPGKRKIHQRIIPRAGGAALLVSFAAILAIWNYLPPRFVSALDPRLFDSIAFASLGVFIIGVLDDTYAITIENRAKLVLELLIAGEIVLLGDLRFVSFSLGDIHVPLSWAGYPLSVLWVAALANAVNLIDGVDGLAGSVCGAGLLALGFLSWYSNQVPQLLLCALLLGLVLAFLAFNRPPARVFLGDTGSLFLGVLLAVISMQLANRSPAIPILSFVFLAGLPLIDLSLSMVRRFIKARLAGAVWHRCLRHMTVADNAHIHHRLVHRGLSHAETSVLLFMLSAGFCATAVLLVYQHLAASLCFILYTLLVLAWFLHRLDFFRFRFAWPGARRAGQIPSRLAIGIVGAGAVLRQALRVYRQNEFSFHFLSAESAMRDTGFSAIIVADTLSINTETPESFSHRIAAIHGCPVIYISAHSESALLADLPPGLVYAHWPVYVPALLFELYRLARPMESVAGRNRINITKLPLEVERSFYVKKL